MFKTKKKKFDNWQFLLAKNNFDIFYFYSFFLAHSYTTQKNTKKKNLLNFITIKANNAKCV